MMPLLYGYDHGLNELKISWLVVKMMRSSCMLVLGIRYCTVSIMLVNVAFFMASRAMRYRSRAVV